MAANDGDDLKKFLFIKNSKIVRRLSSFVLGLGLKLLLNVWTFITLYIHTSRTAKWWIK